MTKLKVAASLAVLAMSLPAFAQAKTCPRTPQRVVVQKVHKQCRRTPPQRVTQNNCLKQCHKPPRNTSAHCPS